MAHYLVSSKFFGEPQEYKSFPTRAAAMAEAHRLMEREEILPFSDHTKAKAGSWVHLLTFNPEEDYAEQMDSLMNMFMDAADTYPYWDTAIQMCEDWGCIAAWDCKGFAEFVRVIELEPEELSRRMNNLVNDHYGIGYMPGQGE